MGQFVYKSKAEAKRYFSELLWKYPLGREITGEESSRLLENLKMHPDSRTKCGEHGIKSFFPNPDNTGSRCFHFRRTDGVVGYFSYRHAIVGSESMSKGFYDACRSAIWVDEKQYREDCFDSNDTIKCPISGVMITQNETHVHHNGDWSFSKIVEAYIKDTHIDVNTIEYSDSVKGWNFTDKALIADFRMYHALKADLQCISIDEHKKLY
jgi:hypothetical protein